jgi:hypothetical protein
MSFLRKIFGKSEKRFKIPGAQIRRLIPPTGGCLATDHIVVDGKSVGFMYREGSKFDGDSGWRFFSGKESQAYTDDLKHTGIYDVNTIANYDSAIIPYLGAEVGCAFGRVVGTDRFEKESFSPPND